MTDAVEKRRSPQYGQENDCRLRLVASWAREQLGCGSRWTNNRLLGDAIGDTSPSLNSWVVRMLVIEEHVVLHKLNSAVTLIQRTTTEAPR